MDAAVLESLEQMTDRYVPTEGLNQLMKQFITEKAQEGSIWGAVSFAVHHMLGGTSVSAVRMAAVTELLVLALDIMDDLQDLDNPDKSWMRCPPAHAQNAILAFLMMAEAEAAGLGACEQASRMVRRLSELLLRSVGGQHQDLCNTVESEDDYVQMVQEKSGSLMQTAFYMGYAAVDGLPQDVVMRLDQAADCIGVAAQLRNDLGDVCRLEEKNDLLERKRTLPTLYLLEHAEEDFPPFKQFFEQTISLEQFLAQRGDYMKFLEDSGCVEYVGVIESLFLSRAEELLADIPADPAWKEKLLRLTVLH